MLPTPDTSHVPYERVYEPAEDSFLFLDTLTSEAGFLQASFPRTSAAPLVVEVGTGSGVILAFVTAHAATLFGHDHVLTAGVDMNAFACRATNATVRKACAEPGRALTRGTFLGSTTADLVSAYRRAAVDVLLFNPPYVPTTEVPGPPPPHLDQNPPTWDDDSYLLSLSWAGGTNGMETTERWVAALPWLLSPRGCAYLLLCASNRPDEVMARIARLGPDWTVHVVGDSGRTAGREKLKVLKIGRVGDP